MQRDVQLPTRLQALAALEASACDSDQWRHRSGPGNGARFLCVFHPHLVLIRATPVAALAPCKARPTVNVGAMRVQSKHY